VSQKLTVVTIQVGDTSGTVELVDWDYEWIKKFVSAGPGKDWIEHVTLSLHPKIGMYINEEGKIMDPPLPVNDLATRLYRESRGNIRFPGDTIEGPAVLVGGPDPEGDEESLSEDALNALRLLKIIPAPGTEENSSVSLTDRELYEKERDAEHAEWDNEEAYQVWLVSQQALDDEADDSYKRSREDD
jgi:hypothetical protein